MDWRLIESAPKDGTRIIVGVWVHDEDRGETFWSDWIESYFPAPPHWGEDGTNGDEPTHWTNLPDPPE